MEPFGIPCLATGKTGLSFQTFFYSRKFVTCITGILRKLYGKMVKHLKDAGIVEWDPCALVEWDFDCLKSVVSCYSEYPINQLADNEI